MILNYLIGISVEFEPDVYTIASETEALGGMTTDLRNRRARLVDIGSRSCLCPNCGAQLIPLLLDEEERKRVRLGLMKIASTSSMNQLKNIQVSVFNLTSSLSHSPSCSCSCSCSCSSCVLLTI